jgi:hypothetical protein
MGLTPKRDSILMARMQSAVGQCTPLFTRSAIIVVIHNQNMMQRPPAGVLQVLFSVFSLLKMKGL